MTGETTSKIAPTLLERFKNGDRVALARLISRVEDRVDGYHELLARVFSMHRVAYRVGLTGPPGAGKSSLVNRLAAKLADEGHLVGIIAVDPTSPFSGGALLGDRVRMASVYGRENVYVRSMATRGAPGGLAGATKDVCVLLEGFGFDVILVETVGVGQVELDVASVCDTVVVVFVPESGDAIQAMKSGLMEIADIYCLNKADRPGSERICAEVESILDVQRQIRQSASGHRGRHARHWEAPVVPTVAIRESGIEELWAAIEKHRAYHLEEDPDGLKRARAKSDLTLSLSEIAHERLRTELIESGRLDEAVDQIVTGRSDPYTLTRKLFSQWCQEHR
ncbi:MAG: methylmalonyl Co-A mutase-associated GTPase MeaB [Candidatus Zixiibacteriota bacterium]